MIKHMVLFELRKDATQTKIKSFYKNLYRLKDKIPGIISIEGGKNISKEGYSKNFKIGFIISFKDKKSRDNYVKHREHKKFVEKSVDPLTEDCIVFDF